MLLDLFIFLVREDDVGKDTLPVCEGTSFLIEDIEDVFLNLSD
ncbi:hypothetical protein CP061683_2557 [Chlamydia psittaci 06-1683]|nr:hypothetical protein CP061683_2557 [Chlamydia psittaci 06-1683]